MCVYLYHIAQNFGGVGTARILAEKTLAVADAKPIQYLSSQDLKFLVDKTLADWE